MPPAVQLPIRVMLLDDHPIVRQGFMTALQTADDILVVGSFTASRDLMTALNTSTAHVLLVDYALGPTDTDGINLIRALRIRFPNSRILIASGHYTAAIVLLAFRAGAHGFIGKTQPVDDLVKAVRAVANGTRYLDRAMAENLDIDATAQNQDCSGSANDDALISVRARLSARESEVLRCVVEGMSVTEIAQKFARSVNTISTQKQAAFRKLGVRNDTELFSVITQRIAQ